MVSFNLKRDINRSKAGHEAGFSLAIIMLFTIVFSVVIAIIADAQERARDRKTVEAMAWHLDTVAKAARLYVRNNSISQYMEDVNADGIPEVLRNSAYITTNNIDRNNDGVVDNLYEKAVLEPGGGGLPGRPAAPTQVIVAALVAAGYLPASFQRTDASGTDMTEQTALGNPITVYVANSPVDGDPSLDTTVATAYVGISDSPRTDAADIIKVSQALQSMGTPVTAPLYSGGANVSDTCGGNTAVGIWDTGCLDDDMFDLLTGNAAGTGVFTEGSFVLPSWKTVQQDSRAIMRFPQPEDPNYATMFTDLRLARDDIDGSSDTCDTVDEQILVAVENDGVGGITTAFSELCKSVRDNPVGQIDNRRDVYNVTDLNAIRVIAADQRDRIVDGNNYRDVRRVINGAGGFNVIVGEVVTPALRGNTNLSPGSDGNDTEDYDDVVAVGGTMAVSGNTQLFNDADYGYAGGARKAVFSGNLGVEGTIFVANEAGSDATATVQSLTGDRATLATEQLNANSAIMHVGINQGTSVGGGGGLTADEAKAEDQTELSLNSLTIPNGLYIDPTILDGADNIGLTAAIMNFQDALIFADSGIFLGEIETPNFTIADQGNGIFQAIPGFDPDINVVISNFINSSGNDVSVNDMDVEGFIDVDGSSRFRGNTNISNGSGTAICSSVGNNCPSTEDSPGTPL